VILTDKDRNLTENKDFLKCFLSQKRQVQVKIENNVLRLRMDKIELSKDFEKLLILIGTLCMMLSAEQLKKKATGDPIEIASSSTVPPKQMPKH